MKMKWTNAADKTAHYYDEETEQIWFSIYETCGYFVVNNQTGHCEKRFVRSEAAKNYAEEYMAARMKEEARYELTKDWSFADFDREIREKESACQHQQPLPV